MIRYLFIIKYFNFAKEFVLNLLLWNLQFFSYNVGSETHSDKDNNRGFVYNFFVIFESLCFSEIISLCMALFVCLLFIFSIFFSFRLIFAKSTVFALGYFSAFLLTLFFSLFLLGLDYFSLVFLIVYVGGVAVLFLFGIFLMDGFDLVIQNEKKTGFQLFIKIFFFIFFIVCMFYLFFYFLLQNSFLNFYELYFLSATYENFLLDLNTGFLLQKFSDLNSISMRSLDFFIIAFFLYEYYSFFVLFWGFVLFWILLVLNDFVYFFPAGMREFFVGYQIYLKNIQFSFNTVDKRLLNLCTEKFISFIKILFFIFLVILFDFFMFFLDYNFSNSRFYVIMVFSAFLVVYLSILVKFFYNRIEVFWFYLYFVLTAMYINKIFFYFGQKNNFLTWYSSLKLRKKARVILQSFFLKKFFQFYYFMVILDYNLENRMRRWLSLYTDGISFFLENFSLNIKDSSLIFAKNYISSFIKKGVVFSWYINFLFITLFLIIYKLPERGNRFFFTYVLEILSSICIINIQFYFLIFILYIFRNFLYKFVVGFQNSSLFCWRITLKIFCQIILYTLFVNFLLFFFIFISGLIYGYFVDSTFFILEIITFFFYYYFYFSMLNYVYMPLLIVYIPLILLFFLFLFFAVGYFYLWVLKRDYYINRISFVHLEYGYTLLYTVFQHFILIFQIILFMCVISIYLVFEEVTRIVNFGIVQEFLNPVKVGATGSDFVTTDASAFYFFLKYAEKLIFSGQNFYLFGVSWHFDLLSILLVGLTVIIFTLCFIYNMANQKIFEIDVLFFQVFLYFILEIILIIFFFTDNLLIFYATFELSLLPTFILIWFFGKRSRRVFASYSFIFYTICGSALFLIVLIFVYHKFSTFEISILTFLCRKESIFFQKFCWFATFLAFAVKIPLVPVHSWLPETHVEAPTAVSVILAAILLKLGLYGLVRITLPFFPQGTVAFSNYVLVIGIIGLLYSTIICFYQIDIKKIVAYSSVAHMSGAVLSLFLGTKLSILSFYIMIFSHAFISAALFFLIGCLYDRYSSRLVKDFGGIARILPNFSFFFFYFFFANIGLPGTPNFWSEFYLISSLYSLSFNGLFSLFFKIFLIVLFLTGVYSLVNLVKILFGELKNLKTFYKDLSFYEIVPLLFLFISSLFFGIFPDSFYGLLMPNVLQTLYFFQNV